MIWWMLACTSSEPAAPPPAPEPAPITAPEPAPAAEDFRLDREVTVAELEGRSLRELSLLRNTIYAQLGHTFVKTWLDAHFRAQPWYRPTDAPDYSQLSDLDRNNAATIGAVEAGLTVEQLSARLEANTAALATATGAEKAALEIEDTLLRRALGTVEGAADPLSNVALLDQQLTRRQLDEMSLRDLRLLRNTIFARRGRSFASPVLDEYFAGKTWYQIDPDYSDARLTDTDRRNVQLVVSVEAELGGPLGDLEMMPEGFAAA